jgi:hypothetical protein
MIVSMNNKKILSKSCKNNTNKNNYSNTHSKIIKNTKPIILNLSYEIKTPLTLSPRKEAN